MRCVKNVELSIILTSDATEKNAKTYFDYLTNKIKKKSIQHIDFSKVNFFFKSDIDLGFLVSIENKVSVGHFKLRLLLSEDKPEKTNSIKTLMAKAIE